ncbi:HEPACAM family member 2-like isoform X2 [Caretta caretta]|uniref:HEPACAM family member 2-like isoform X2 n=1 Tax=Caretta caretta TaxID=8467 RepID=UPI0020940CC4|nr:HEPACAM family member 2-like isoform X2 [Caretta caretta]
MRALRGAGLRAPLSVAWLISWCSVIAGPPGEKMTAAAGSCIMLPGLDQLQGVSLMQWKFSEQYLVIYHVNNSSFPDVVDQDRFLFQKSNGSLQICRLKVNDSGIYTLIINMKKQNERSIQLEVVEPVSQPELWSNLSLIGLSTELVCSTSVEKVAKYQWKKDGKPLPIESHYQLSQNNSVLLILNTTWSDKGSYSCNVSNEVNWHEVSLELPVQQYRKRIWMLLPVGICMIAYVVTGFFIFKSSS